MHDVEKLIEENRKMKMEIHKLQMTQYAMSDFDNKSEMSQNSFQRSNKFSQEGDKESRSNKVSGFELPSEQNSPRNRNVYSGNTTHNSSKYDPTHTNSSLVRAGKNLLHSDSSIG